MESCPHFKFMQAERLNVITLTTDTYLTNEMSGSVIIANIESSSMTIKLPKPDSGLNYKIILKASTTTLTYNLTVESTSNDVTSDTIINLIGNFTEKSNAKIVQEEIQKIWKYDIWIDRVRAE